MTQDKYVLAFDTANEFIAIGIGRLEEASSTVECISSEQIQAHRASNTKLLLHIDTLCNNAGITRADIACVVAGTGPGSFTGVRIALATAKGIADALEVALVGVSSLDAVAWNVWANGVRGQLLVVADAMRQEVYPARFALDDGAVTRINFDCVTGIELFVEYTEDRSVCNEHSEDEHAKDEHAGGESVYRLVHTDNSDELFIAGDALVKYADIFTQCGTLLNSELWVPTGEGLLLAFQTAWREHTIDPFDAERHAPATVLPIYTRLSDAEENERIRLSRGITQEESLDGKTSGIVRDSRHVTMNDTAVSNARANKKGFVYKPLDRAHAESVAKLEAAIMGTDAWNESQVADELGRSNRIWWAAYAADPSMPLTSDAPLVGYAGAMVIDGDMQILKIGVDEKWRRHGVARNLLAHLVADARNLGATTCSLEVRVSNKDAQSFYRMFNLEEIGVRPHYYSDREDALIMNGVLCDVEKTAYTSVAGMDVQQFDNTGVSDGEAVKIKSDSATKPLILAIESSCDETAAAIINGEGHLVADVVASQIDFHARFGGVVPEIASRKHIEAICGVCDACLETAAQHIGADRLRWRDLDAIAVTYAPGLIGALVVGVAFAKGIAWAADIPFIGVNHLEGHIYANKLGDASFEPPAVISLVSGGNTMLVHMRDWGDYTILGATIDDAVGEAFDKVAKALGLGYPGGPAISHYAEQGNSRAVDFPRAMMHSGDMRFSLSGLKTAVVTYINQQRAAGVELNVADIAASFQQAVIDVQIKKARMAIEQTGVRTFCLGGGVAANPQLRKAYENLCDELGVKLIMPPLHACGDNAGMIALVALDRYREGKFFDFDADAVAHANLEEPY